MIARIVRLPPVLFFSFLVAGSAIQSRIPLSLGMPSGDLALATGGVLMIVAATIAFAAISEFRRYRTTVEPGQRPAALVTTGVFSFSRNPMYVALVLASCGIAAMTDALWLLGTAALLWLTLDRFVVRSEERVIEQTFELDYLAYKRRVRRWLGWSAAPR